MPGSRTGGAFELTVIDRRSGFVSFVADPKPGTGRTCSPAEIFQNEPGGHRFQRIPPTERHGRVHTSTVTVAVLPVVEDQCDLHLRQQDLEIFVARGSGPGGQARNKTESAVRVTHLPSKISVRCDVSRSQHKNKQLALSLLVERLREVTSSADHASTNKQRQQQIGLGQRGDKRRTIRFQDDSVRDHITGRTWRLRDYLKGEW